MDWIKAISDGLAAINKAYDTVKTEVFSFLGIADPLHIMPYRGYGTAQQLHLKGRVLQDEGITPTSPDTPFWKNLINMYRRFESDEVPGAKLQASFHSLEQEVVTDDEGFFDLKLQLPQPLDGDRSWHPVDLKLLDPQKDDQPPATAVGEVLVPPASAQFGVISDIDDTIVRTAATDQLRMIQIVYFSNAQSRVPFPGSSAFYRALHQGGSGQDKNPLFYVSSSAWNMYDVFAEFLEANQFPLGPILLRDIELSPHNLLSFTHEEHKLGKIYPILNCYPDLPFILMGDSGQKDAEIYRQIVQDYAHQIQAIYIRDVVPEDQERQEKLKAIAAEIQDLGVPFILIKDTLSAAHHAIDQGWITQKALSAVQAEAEAHPAIR